MTHEEVRKLILKALCTQDWLYNHLVMKGGNALSLVYNVGDRTSLDLDFSIKNDFRDVQKVSKLMAGALTSALDRVGILVFDFKLESKPKVTHASWWGGYAAEFKLISKTAADTLCFRIEEMRRQALTIDPGSQRRRYAIEISKFEFIDESVIKNVGDFHVRVYSPLLIAIEKLRAILQQHSDYTHIPLGSKRSRARDFYDIWAICDFFVIKLDMYLPTVQMVFDAKKVNLSLLNRLQDVRSLHAASWSDVELSVSSDLENFDFYFDYVEHTSKSLYAKWIKNLP